MACKLKVNTLQGGIIILDITPTVTVRELKVMLLEHAPCEHPLERRILKVKLLNDKTLIDDGQASQTIVEAGLLHATETNVAEVTVLYTRSEMEAVTSREIPLLSRPLQVNIPDATTEVSEGAFQDCRKIVRVNIPESVIRIENSAFAGCSSLVSIKIPDSVTHMGNGVFEHCSSLTGITIPDSVTQFGHWAFEQCSCLQSIHIPPAVQKLGWVPFYAAVH